VWENAVLNFEYPVFLLILFEDSEMFYCRIIIIIIFGTYMQWICVVLCQNYSIFLTDVLNLETTPALNFVVFVNLDIELHRRPQF
jgi:hypothetical protein